MRLLLLTLIVSLFAGCALLPKKDTESPIVIKEIKPRYIDEQQFMRASEYWTGKEETGKRIISRTDSTERSGYYFTLILSERARELPRGSFILGEFYTTNSLDLQSHEFHLPSKLSKSKEIFLGLTGADAPAGGKVPGAWRFTIKTAGGEVIAQDQSYLWEL